MQNEGGGRDNGTAMERTRTGKGRRNKVRKQSQDREVERSVLGVRSVRVTSERRINYNDKMPKNPHWEEGKKYDVCIGYIHWYDRGMYHGRAPIWIKDKKTGKIVKRVGDVRMIGNFSPIWIAWNGKSISLANLLRL